MDTDVVSIYSGILVINKQEWNHAIGSNMIRTRDCHPMWKKQKKTNITWYHLYANLKQKYKWTYLPNRNRVRDGENKIMVTKG